MSYLRKILKQVDPSLSTNLIAEKLVKMCMEHIDLCKKYLYDK